MTERGFRILLVAHLAVLLAAVTISAAFPQLLPPWATEAHRIAEESSLLERSWAGYVIVPFVLAALAGYVGLFLWQSWGRTLSVASTLVGFGLYPLLGPTVASWAESSLMDMGNILWGAVLALAYFGPVSARFDASDSSRERAVHDAP
jgi:hypothetical protein